MPSEHHALSVPPMPEVEVDPVFEDTPCFVINPGEFS